MKKDQDITIIDKIRILADKQMADPDKAEICFEFNGQSIVNPWMDPSGRFELNTEESIDYYGKENFTSFLSRAGNLIMDSEISKEERK